MSLLLALTAASSLALQVGYAVNPEAPKIDMQYRFAPDQGREYLFVGIQGILDGPAEGYIYGGFQWPFKIGRWELIPQFGLGAYFEQQPRKPYRKLGTISKRWYLAIEGSYVINDDWNVGINVNAISTLTNGIGEIQHVWDRGGAGSTIAISWRRKF